LVFVNVPRLLRFLYLAGLFFVVPAVGAGLIVSLVAPSDGFVPLTWFGSILVFFRDQRVPVGILLFTVLEYALWKYRHRLPGAALLGHERRRGVPTSLQPAYDKAMLLLDDTERLMRKHDSEIHRLIAPQYLDLLSAHLEELRQTMLNEPFEGHAFTKALTQAEGSTNDMLARWKKGELREYVESIGVAVAVALLLRIFLVEAFKIPSGSMIPTLHIGDHIFVNKMAYGPLVPLLGTRIFPRLPPQRGDVMVFEFPENREQDFIKRVVAIPGDRLEVQDGHPLLNGWRVPHCTLGSYPSHDADSPRLVDLDIEFLEDKAYLTAYDRSMYDRGVVAAPAGEHQGPYTVKTDEVWVLGDNRNNSHDSRGWFGGRGGGVPFGNIKGRAMFVWLSVRQNGNVAWNRVGTRVMGDPKLLPVEAQKLTPEIQRCLAQRPPFSATKPPAP